MTALQELIYFLHVNNNLEELNENLQVHDIMYKIHDLLAKEKQQIIDAWDDCFFLLMADLKPKSAEDYYNETFNQTNQ
jgi:hypothetical protein